MSGSRFPALDGAAIASTRSALHGYAGVLGDLLKAYRPRRKHWWHASLRPSLTGVTTGIVRAEVDFQVSLDLYESLAQVETATGGEWLHELSGQSAADFATSLRQFLLVGGMATAPKVHDRHSANTAADYSRQAAGKMAQALAAVSGALEQFRAGIREQCSPIQVWPHHFDLSMLWLPGESVADADAADEEQSDKQMNFGFVFGDEGIAEPYFYVTAYPFVDAMTSQELPKGARWQTEGFSGAMVTWQEVRKSADPVDYLLSLWHSLLSTGRRHLVSAG